MSKKLEWGLRNVARAVPAAYDAYRKVQAVANTVRRAQLSSSKQKLLAMVSKDPRPKTTKAKAYAKLAKGGRVKLKTALYRVPTYRGRMGKGLPRRPRKKNYLNFEKEGFVVQWEGGAIVTDASACYLAHGGPSRVLFEAAMGGVTRKVLKNFGINFRSWNNAAMTGSATDSFTWRVGHKLSPGGAVVVTASVGALGSTTPLNLALDLGNLFCSLVVIDSTYFEPTFIECRWTRTDADHVERWEKVANDIDIHLYFKSVLSMQNRTPAQTGAVDETSMLDVANNPIKGKVFFGKGTCINAKSQSNTPGGNNFLTIDKDSGVATIGVDTVVSSTAGLRKVPQFHAFTGAYGSTNIMLAPGEIRDDTLVFRKKMSLPSFIKMMVPWLRTGLSTSTTSSSMEINWPYRMIGLDRKLDTRTAEPPVTVGYEVNNTVMAMIKCHQRDVPLRLLALA